MIREAVEADSADIARLILLAMGDLASRFIGEGGASKAFNLFEKFASIRSNQYSYENTLIYEDEGSICGSITAYAGEDLELLRKPFLAYIKDRYNVVLHPEAETGAGEYYIDCLAVFEEHQGRAIGKKLIRALIKKALSLNYSKVGLLVSKDNAEAERFYVKQGFKVVGPLKFMGGEYWHMQCDCSLLI